MHLVLFSSIKLVFLSIAYRTWWSGRIQWRSMEIYAWFIPPFSIAKKKYMIPCVRHIQPKTHTWIAVENTIFKSCFCVHGVHLYFDQNVTHGKSSFALTRHMFALNSTEFYHFGFGNSSKSIEYMEHPWHMGDSKFMVNTLDHLPFNRIPNAIHSPISYRMCVCVLF